MFEELLCGRELPIDSMNSDYKFKYAFPLIGNDFLKMTLYLKVSVAIVLTHTLYNYSKYFLLKKIKIYYLFSFEVLV